MAVMCAKMDDALSFYVGGSKERDKGWHLPQHLSFLPSTSCPRTEVQTLSPLHTHTALHVPHHTGGVVPNLAMEAHAAAIDRVVEQALARAGISASQLDAVAVTVGPGLALCLRVGVAKARQVAREHQLPIVHCHHMEGHALVARLPKQQQMLDSSVRGTESLGASSSSMGAVSPSGEEASSSGEGVSSSEKEASSSTAPLSRGGSGASSLEPAVEFPFLCLLVSGGHNLLLLVRGVGQYVQLGSTLDDALGEPAIEDWVFSFQEARMFVGGVSTCKPVAHFEFSTQSICRGGIR